MSLSPGLLRPAAHSKPIPELTRRVHSSAVLASLFRREGPCLAHSFLAQESTLAPTRCDILRLGLVKEKILVLFTAVYCAFAQGTPLEVCIRTCQWKLITVQLDKMSLDPEHTLVPIST